MPPKKPTGPLHRMPADMKRAVQANAKSREAWTEITPLARNEWICWVTSAKLAATRAHRTARAVDDLSKGKRRPCCWPGCPHRRASAKKWF